MPELGCVELKECGCKIHSTPRCRSGGSRVYQIQTMAIALGDGMGTHISIYLTIISAYLVVSYLVAAKLTTLQISIATGIYVVAYTFQSIVLISYFRSLSMAAAALNELAVKLHPKLTQ